MLHLPIAQYMYIYTKQYATMFNKVWSQLAMLVMILCMCTCVGQCYIFTVSKGPITAHTIGSWSIAHGRD